MLPATRTAPRPANGRGFTLIELVVALTLVGILASIAIPAYMNYRATTTDAATRSDAANTVEFITHCAQTAGLETDTYHTPQPGQNLDAGPCGNLKMSPGTDITVDVNQALHKYVVTAHNGEGTPGLYYTFCSTTDTVLQENTQPAQLTNCPDGQPATLPGSPADTSPKDPAALVQSHNCYLTNSRNVGCWGNNGNGQLGDGTTSNSPIAVTGETTYGPLTNVMYVSARYLNTCVATFDGKAYCAGDNTKGQIGDGTTTDSHIFTRVQGLTDVASVYTGYYRSYAVTNSGDLYAWGYNSNGQLGDGTTTDRHTPVRVVGPGGSGYLTDIQGVFVADYYTCAVTDDADAYCWGSNFYGQLGDGTTGDSAVPVEVQNITP